MADQRTDREVMLGLESIQRDELVKLVEKAGNDDRRLGLLAFEAFQRANFDFGSHRLDVAARKDLGKLVRTYVVDGVAAPEIQFCVAVWSETRRRPCSGILWSRDIVLTAGHCEALGYRKYVTITPKVAGDAKRYLVRSSRRHPEFVGDPYYHRDVAMLFLEEEVEERIVFPKLAAEEEVTKARAGVVVGYGSTDVQGNSGFGERRKADLSILWNRRETPRTPAGDAVLYNKDWEFVAVPKGRRGDACLGDSGGPLLIATDAGVRLAAMVSRDAGMSEDACGGGTIYVRLDRFQKWIEERSAQVDRG